MTLEKQHIQILKERGLITGVMYYENQEILDILTTLAQHSFEWDYIKMFMEAPQLIDNNDDNEHTSDTGKVEKEHRVAIKVRLSVEDPHLFNAYQTNKMRKNFILPLFVILPEVILLPRDEKRFQELRFQFSGSSDPKCTIPKAYEYEMTNSRKRGFIASLVALIENVAKSQIIGQKVTN